MPVAAHVTGTALCAHLGCTRDTINDYVAKDIIKREASGRYDQDACRLKVLAYLRDRAAGRTGGGENNLSEARANLARAQTAGVAMKNAVARGEYVPVADVERETEVMLTSFREKALTIPGKLAPHVEMRSREEVEELLRVEIHELLDELSRSDDDGSIAPRAGSGIDPGGVEPGAAGVEASAEPEFD